MIQYKLIKKLNKIKKMVDEHIYGYMETVDGDEPFEKISEKIENLIKEIKNETN